MSVSSHLTPEPERRLWVIYGNMSRATERADMKIGALTAFAAAQMALVKFITPDGPMSRAAILLLAMVLPLGVFAFSSLSETRSKLPLIEPAKEKGREDDLLTSVNDIAKYPLSELILRLDRYLGGGITATQYHEDIVGLIVFNARIAVRKQRLFRTACVITVLAQLCLLIQLILG